MKIRSSTSIAVFVSSFAVLAISAAADTAHAQSPAKPPPAASGVVVTDGKNTQEIIFTDTDELKTQSLSPSESVIKGRPKGVRTILVRPRTSWVPEMLKTIELL